MGALQEDIVIGPGNEPLLELARADLHSNRDNVIDRQPGDFGMLAAGLSTRRFEFTKGMLAVGSDVTAYPLHAQLIAGRHRSFANRFQLFRG